MTNIKRPAMDDVVHADWITAPGGLAEWLGEWAKRGYTPAPPTPTPLVVEGVAVLRYRMVFVGIPYLSDSLGPGPGQVREQHAAGNA